MRMITEAELKNILKEYLEKEIIVKITGIISAGVVINKYKII